MSRPSVWRHAGRAPTIFGVPVVAFLPMILFLFHWAWWTFYLSVGVVAFYTFLRYKLGYTFPVLWGRLLHKLRGPHVHARPWWYRKRYQGLHAGRKI